MKKSIAIAAVATIMLSAAAMAANTTPTNNDNKVVTGAKKVGMAIVWPFKKVGQGFKAVGNKITGK